MINRVLILGNGISRKVFDIQIQAFDGEVWACNNAFREYPQKITRLTGHTEPMLEAQEWKEKHGFRFEIYSGPMAKKHPAWKVFTVGPEWQRDSGTTMVAEALEEGYEVELVGFDLGGPDVYAFDQYRQDKTCWVDRWSQIVQKWGPDRLHFWGQNHLPFIRAVASGLESAKKYARLYLRRQPHITGDAYREFFRREKKVAEKMVKVKFPNGYETLMRETVALIFASKNQVKVLDENPKIEEKHVVTPEPVKDAEPVKAEDPSPVVTPVVTPDQGNERKGLWGGNKR